MREKVLAIILLVIIPGLLFAAPRNILEDDIEDTVGRVEIVSAESGQFDPAWDNYLNAFKPVKDAIVKGDYKAMRPWVNHLKEASVRLSKTKAPKRYGKSARKIQKEVLKGTKSLLKAAKSGNRSKIRQHYDHLKDSIDRMEQLRLKHS